MVMSNNKQTSVEQLFHKLWDTPKDKFTWYAMLKEHMEMEKERIETAYNKGTVHGIDYPESTLPITGEQYYNETYGSNETIQ
jgi:hypothetical protein